MMEEPGEVGGGGENTFQLSHRSLSKIFINANDGRSVMREGKLVGGRHAVMTREMHSPHNNPTDTA